MFSQILIAGSGLGLHPSSLPLTNTLLLLRLNDNYGINFTVGCVRVNCGGRFEVKCLAMCSVQR